MKKSILSTVTLAVFLSLTGCASTEYKTVEVASVVNVPNQSQKILFQKTRQWFSQYFVSGESVVDYEDAASGTIIGNGIANIGSDPFGLIQYDIKYNIRIDIKDNKFRALTKIIEHTNTDSNRTYTVGYLSKGRIADAEKKVNEIVKNIESYVTNQKLGDSAEW
jgi:flagellin-like hook-associated protein FlgL